MGKELQKIESFRTQLAIAETIEEIKLLGDSGKAYQDLMRRQKIGKDKQDEIGLFLIEIEEKKGKWLDEFYPSSRSSNQYKKVVGLSDKPTNSLQELGINKNESSRARFIAREENEDLKNEVIDEIKSNPDKTITPYSVYQGIKNKNNVHVSNNSGNNEWYTPSEYIESARIVMDEIDLDPASSDIANKTVKANTYYTKTNNGLNKKWYGNIWLNPPYSQPLISQFSEAIVDKRLSYKQACILVNNATETNWLQRMLMISNAVCFLKGRVKFIDMDGNKTGAPLQGQVIIYIGDNIQGFIDEFKKFGICMIQV